MAASLSSLLQVVPPGSPVRRWHVSPIVDSAAYHWSWVLALVPMLMMGDTKKDYIVLWILVLALNFAHRHLTLPIVYCDRLVLASHPVKFTIAPIAIIALFAVEPAMRKSDTFGVAFIAIVTFSGAWGIWHTVQQKYGILRLYAVKSETPEEVRPPPWVDRMLVHGWFPLWIVYLGTAHRGAVETGFARARLFLDPLLDVLIVVRPWLLPLSGLLVVTSVSVFLWYEWRGSRFSNPARLFMGIGTACLSASFLIFDPVKVFLAYTFSHAVEYFVFVWAYERKRFAAPHPRRSLLERVLSRPAFFASFLFAVGGAYVLVRCWGVQIFPEAERLRWGGRSGMRWIYFWGISQSMIHFYYDGFLWKMRSPETRANI